MNGMHSLLNDSGFWNMTEYKKYDIFVLRDVWTQSKVSGLKFVLRGKITLMYRTFN